ncbi:HlyD family efflux transporter periplasmic adaptor subunit [Deinococcus sp.]|uniref:efflux RND transporter periplasmic adaptor subunit n=1 Tax=Deinococcus sp. TaxID=47478 RepID=UPI0025C492AD|nr:HlyD family efflux transporter periplasmic adaptor subunit [Deinococcus sp.]
MSQTANLPPDPNGLPPAPVPVQTGTVQSQTVQPETVTQTVTPAPQPPRRGLLRWILIPLLIAGVGFVGYRLGQTATTSQAGASSMGGAAQTGAGAGTGAGSGTTRRHRSAEVGTGSGTAASGAGVTGAATGATGAAGGFTGVVTPVQASVAQAGSLSTERRLAGTVSPAQTTTVNTQAAGTVTAINKNVGDQVGAGQTVLTLNNKDLASSVDAAQNTLGTAQAQLDAQQAQIDAGTASLQQAITAAQASLANAQSTYAANQKLYEVGAIAKATLDAQEVQVQSARNSLIIAQTNLATNTRTNNSALITARLNVQKAKIALAQAQNAAGNARVTAPYDGVITVMNAAQGQYLNANAAAFTLVSTAQQVKFNLPATEAGTLPVGAELTYVVGQQKYPIKVVQNAGGGSGSVPVTAKFTGTAQAPQGSVGSVVYTATVAKGILVPSTALQVDGTTTYVFTIQSGQARQHNVTVLGQAGTQSAISGIEAGTQVISQPPTGLLDGASVTTSARTRSRSGRAQGGPPGGMP